jgi:hypothetical protein
LPERSPCLAQEAGKSGIGYEGGIPVVEMSGCFSGLPFSGICLFELLGYPEEGGNVFIRKRRRNGLLAGFFRAGFEAVPHGGFL